MFSLNIPRLKRRLWYYALSTILVVALLFTWVKVHQAVNIIREDNLILEEEAHDENIKTSTKHDLDLLNKVAKDEKYSRELNDDSPFQHLKNFIKIENESSEEDNIPISKENAQSKFPISLTEWDDSNVISMTEQCKILIDGIYVKDENWSNDYIFDDESKAEKELSTYGERLRIYYHCFLFNDVKPSDIFNASSVRTTLSFQHRMFPFLKTPNEDEVLLPKVLDLYTKEPVTFVLKTSPEEHNENFWYNWAQMSNGKGIITTFPEDGADFFLRLLQVFQYLNNTLPIQVLVNEDELSDKFVDQLAHMGNMTNQHMYLVTYSNLLDSKIKDHIKGYMKNFLASMFNSFAEYIFIDADIITFIEPEKFFEFSEYKDVGMYITRDRDLDEWNHSHCIESLAKLEPTKEEVDFIKTSLRYTINSLENETFTGESTYMFFKENRRHVAESGLMVVNKVDNIQGILTGLMLTLVKKIRDCSYGDKEFFWLGQLYSGLNYEFEPSYAALLGYPKKEYNEKYQYVKTTLCDEHIGHVHEDKLSWAKGGFTKSKVRRKEEEKLDNPRMQLNGFVMPDRMVAPWKPTKINGVPCYCAAAVEVGAVEKTHGKVVWLSSEEYNQIDDISKIWNDGAFHDKL